MGIASLVLGIISLLLQFCVAFAAVADVGFSGFAIFVILISAILAIIFGAIVRQNPEQKKIGTAGFICGIISLVTFFVLSGIFLFLLFSFANDFGNFFDNLL